MGKLKGPFIIQNGGLQDANGIILGVIFNEHNAELIRDALNEWWDAVGQNEDEDDPTQEQEIRL